MSEQLLTYEDLSERWQIPVNTLRIWVMQKRLNPKKLGRHVRFSLAYIREIEEKGLLEYAEKKMA
jgi:hypothetical protein